MSRSKLSRTPPLDEEFGVAVGCEEVGEEVAEGEAPEPDPPMPKALPIAEEATSEGAGPFPPDLGLEPDGEPPEPIPGIGIEPEGLPPEPPDPMPDMEPKGEPPEGPPDPPDPMPGIGIPDDDPPEPPEGIPDIEPKGEEPPPIPKPWGSRFEGESLAEC